MTHRQFATSFLVAVACVAGSALAAPQIWSGLTFTYNHPGGTDPLDAANQDRITNNVWITRGAVQGIFNAAQEPGYNGFDIVGPSPVDTEWAYGTTADWNTLTYTTWAQVHGGHPNTNLPGQNMVVHLISDDIYLDIMFLTWGRSSSEGEFSYIRAVPTPGSVALLGLGGMLAVRRRR